MTKPESLIGRRVGKLMVKEYERRKKSQIYFRCVCDCGNEKWIRKDHLVKEETLSCGCIKYKNYIGEKFGRLTILKRIVKDQKGYFECLCDCGNKKVIVYGSVIYGTTKSCGCLAGERSKNKRAGSRIYNIYQGMKERCYRKGSESYDRYGGRGIKICDEWLNDFDAFHDWAIDNGYDDELTIDRIDNNGNYTPDNCRWADHYTQSNNRRDSIRVEYRGKLMTLKQVAELTGLTPSAVNYRRKKGIDFDKPNRNHKSNARKAMRGLIT